MNLLIIGYGSIGGRHGRLASEAGLKVACVSHNPECPYPCFASVASAINEWKPNRVIVANPTADHLCTLKALDEAGYTGSTLVEKPLFASPAHFIPRYPEQVFVAYNLRFHPLIQRVRELLHGLPIYSAEFHAGQYLPDWRPGTNYRNSYSADRHRGGGVLRDLSHELDLSMWLCGPAQHIVAVGGRFSELDIESDDVYMVIARTEKCPAVAITLNYLNHTAQRTIRINAKGLTANLDLIAGRLEINGAAYIHEIERDYTYRSQLTHFIEGKRAIICSFGEGEYLTRFISSAEASITQLAWQTV